VALKLDRPSGIWAFPVETVSQSEGGFELVHQSVCVEPHWLMRGDSQGRWHVTIELDACCEQNAEVVDEEQVIRL
jgi:alpha-amylase